MLRFAAVTLALPLFASPAAAQGDPLAAWHGPWRGTCTLEPAYRGVGQFEASLTVQPLGLAGRYAWRLVYAGTGTLPRSERNYELRAIDAAAGHYVLDEKNGLLLDAYRAGSGLYLNFAIGGGQITGLYLLLADGRMLLDLPNFAAKPVRRTCLTGDDRTCVDSYRLTSSQRCILAKTPP